MVQIKDKCDFWVCRYDRHGDCFYDTCRNNLCSGYGYCYNCKKIYECPVSDSGWTLTITRKNALYYDFCDYMDKIKPPQRELEQLYYVTGETHSNYECNGPILDYPKFADYDDFCNWLSAEE